MIFVERKNPKYAQWFLNWTNYSEHKLSLRDGGIVAAEAARGIRDKNHQSRFSSPWLNLENLQNEMNISIRAIQFIVFLLIFASS